MKFASGYLVGVATVVAIGVAFCGGVYTHAVVVEKKNKVADDIKSEDILSIMNRIRESRKS